VVTPAEHGYEKHVYYVYTIQTPERDALLAHLEAAGIEARVRDPYLMPEQPAYHAGARGEFPNASRLVRQLLCLPIHEKLTAEDVEYTIGAVRSFFER
jgi:dTDP-4-amino-4,6-dideoxygalactose transaminase